MKQFCKKTQIKPASLNKKTIETQITIKPEQKKQKTINNDNNDNTSTWILSLGPSER